MVIAAMKFQDPCSWKESYDKPTDDSKKQGHHFADKCLYSQSSGFSSSHIQTRELDHKEGWTLKNWCFWIVVLEKILESLLDSKEIKPANPKENEPWIYIGRTDDEVEAPIFWPPDGRNWLIGNAGKNWQQVEKWETESEMVGWHHWLNIHESEQTPRNSEGQGSLVCCKESGTTERLNSNNVNPSHPP